jgi:hypothetical protein
MCKVAQTFNELANASGEGQEPERHWTSVRCLSLFAAESFRIGVTEFGGCGETLAVRHGQNRTGNRFHFVMPLSGRDLRTIERAGPSFLRLADEVPRRIVVGAFSLEGPQRRETKDAETKGFFTD